jgi:hypothetical protein
VNEFGSYSGVAKRWRLEIGEIKGVETSTLSVMLVVGTDLSDNRRQEWSYKTNLKQ